MICSRVILSIGSANSSEASINLIDINENFKSIIDDSDIILTLKFALSIGYYGNRRNCFIVDVKKMKNLWDLSENEILEYARKINANYQYNDIKKINIKIIISELAANYNEMLNNGDCKSYADVARLMKVSRTWVTKVMKYLPTSKA